MPDRPPYDVYVHTDIPEGMTIREGRAERAARVARSVAQDAELDAGVGRPRSSTWCAAS